MSDKQKTLSSMLADYAPKPSQRFYRRMANSPWNRKASSRMFSTPVRRFIVGAAMMIVLFAALTISVPAVRASISAFLGLGKSPSDVIVQPTGTIDLSTPISTTMPATPLQPAATQAPMTQPVGNLNISSDPDIQQVTGLAGWQVLTPTYLPEGYHFDSAYYDATNQLVYLSFFATRKLAGSDLTETKSITLVEAKRNDIVPLMVAPSTTVEDVSVVNTPAAYAIGAWDSSFVQNANELNGGHMEWNWRNDVQVQNIYWQNGDIYLVLITDEAQLAKDELLKMADGISK